MVYEGTCRRLLYQCWSSGRRNVCKEKDTGVELLPDVEGRSIKGLDLVRRAKEKKGKGV